MFEILNSLFKILLCSSSSYLQNLKYNKKKKKINIFETTNGKNKYDFKVLFNK